jgi:prepilin-type N-terminal cleavage/methylation domain-containing protein
MDYAGSVGMKKADAGFTLIEVLVTGIIVAVITGALLTVVNMFFREVGDSTAMSKLQTEYDIVSSQIGSQARVAQYVFAQGETTPVGGAAANTLLIRMVLADGRDSVAYRLVNGILQVSYPPAGWNNFIIGSEVIRVTDSSTFILPAGRKSVGLNLALLTVNNNQPVTLTVPGDAYQCRN